MKNISTGNRFETKYGSFSEDGNEYIIKTPRTPKPWINVISNGDYGLVISQSGGGFSWKTHSEFNRLTRWHQDLIRDDWGKYIYVKNEITGKIWSPTWMPVKQDLSYFECRFGFGYAAFKSVFENIEIILTVFVSKDNVEIWDVSVQNNSDAGTELSFYNYFEWCLGSSSDHHREFHRTFIETKYDEKHNAIIAGKRIWEIPLGDRGHWNIEYLYKGFFASSKKPLSFECDKEAFIGQYGSIQHPLAVDKGELTNTCGQWYDPIGSLKVHIQLKAGASERFSYFLGIEDNEEKAVAKLQLYKDSSAVDSALKDVKETWTNLLSALQIETPDAAMDLMVNKWLRYQAVSCRLWGRTAYYQQSGALGFRDQLQDSLVFLTIDPKLTKEQICLHARHQMKDGTVLHWWHPITETGLKTIMTDDLLWLPFLIIQYINETGDYRILELKEPYYDDKEMKATLYEHCTNAIDRVLKRMSQRGLPFIGAGDWNDGLSAVGLEWKGESIWLAEFLYYILMNFSPLAIKKENLKEAEKYNSRAGKLQKAFELHGWDGEYFYRATKDSGEKIGSSENPEGRIYLNSQSWAVISGITNEDRKQRAMKAVEDNLLKDNGPLLLYPAYTKPDKFIGYITRYAPGKRENGGVYMHAAAWTIWAYSLLKRGDMCYEIFKRICPVYNGMDPDKYAAEPYVNPGNIDGPGSAYYGRGGWTWYTGSAAWLQKVIVDFILGIKATPQGLEISPCIPKDWKGFSVKRTFRSSVYNINVKNPDNVSSGVACIKVNGKEIKGNLIKPFRNAAVSVEVILG